MIPHLFFSSSSQNGAKILKGTMENRVKKGDLTSPMSHKVSICSLKQLHLKMYKIAKFIQYRGWVPVTWYSAHKSGSSSGDPLIAKAVLSQMSKHGNATQGC